MSAEQPGPRIGNQDRERAVAALGEHYAHGRLDGDEYSQRVARVWECRTAPELAGLFADLPDPRPWRGGPSPEYQSGPGYQPGPQAGYQPPSQAGYPPQAGSQPVPQSGYPPVPAQPWHGPSGPGMDPSAPFGREPVTGRPYSDKSKIVAGLLQLFLPFGIGRFYTGHTGIAVAQLLVTFFTFGIGGIWGFIDGIVILAGAPEDTYGRPLHP